MLPAQSGKTRKAEELIRDFKEHEKGVEGASIDIWISANNKLLVHQTTTRFKKDLGVAESDSDAEEEGESNAVITAGIFSWTSGTKASNIPADTLAFKCVDDEVGMIIVCAHKKRLDYIAQLIGRLQSIKFAKKINLWIDEADYSCHLWLKQAALAASPLVNHITLVSATFGEVFRHFPSLKVLPYKITAPEVYRRLKDCTLVEEVPYKTATEYVEAVLTKYPALSAPGMRAFIPGNIAKASHEDLSELLLEKGFAVLILNGVHKEIRLPNGEETVDLRPYLSISDPKKTPDEFNLNLAKLYILHRLNRFPLAITGFLCVERGITFQIAPPVEGSHAEFVSDHMGFLFDYAIVSSIRDKAEAYQAMARVFGNIGSFNDGKCCTIYSDAKTFDKVREQEETAFHMARIVAERLERDPAASTEVTSDDLALASRFESEKGWVLRQVEFNSLEEANEFIASFPETRTRSRKVEADGFYHSSITDKKRQLSYEEIIAAFRGWSKLTGYADAQKNLDKTAFTRLFIGYRDMEDPTTAVFVVRATERMRKRRLVRKGVA